MRLEVGTWTAVAAVVLFTVVPSDGDDYPAGGDGTSSVPHVAMPERVFQALSDALASYPLSESPGELSKEKNLKALQAIKKLPLPDFTKLELVRLHPVKGLKPGRQPAVVWRVPGQHDPQFVVLPNLTEVRIPSRDIAKVEPCSYVEHLTALIQYVAQRAPAARRPRDFTFVWDFGGTGLPYYGGAFWFYEAYVAASLGKTEESRKLLHEGLRQNRLCIAAAYDDGAWQSFARGIAMLEGGSPRHTVLAQWKETLRLFGESQYRQELLDLTGQLEKQVVEDERLRTADVADPEKLPVQQRIEYCLARLPDVHGVQISQPGHCMTVGLGGFGGPMAEGTKISDALVKIGRPAVPRLIEHLDDRRLTRSVGFWRDFAPTRVVLRGQDVAVECIEKIVDIQFYGPSTTSSYLSNEKDERRQAVIEDIKSWWKAYGDKPPLAGFLARLEHGRPRERLDMLRKAEAIDKKAVDSIAILKRWAIEAPAQEAPLYVSALAERGDRSFLPAVRKMAAFDPERTVSHDAIWLLLKQGSAEDYRNLREAARKDIARGSRLGEQRCLWGAVYSGIENTKSPLAVPILVDFLDQREISGVRWLGEGKTMGFSPADRCMETLIRLTGHNEGYRPDAPPNERFASLDRWKAWWRKQGEAEYLKVHPEVRQVLGQQGGETSEVDRATLPAVVDVGDPGHLPVHYQVPSADATALIAEKRIVSSGGADGPRLRFSTVEAAAEWFAKARPTVPQARASGRKALEVVEDSRPGRGLVVGPAGQEWLYEAGNVPIAEVKRQVEQTAAGNHAHVSGPHIVLVDRQQRIWLVPTVDPETLLGYDPTARRWIERRSLGPNGHAGPSDTKGNVRRCPFISCSGLLFFGDDLGVHWFDGVTWGYQRLYQRNIDESRYFFPDTHAFTTPQFAEDAEGRVYVWSVWGQFGWTGTIGFWVFESGTWKNYDPVERVEAIHPHGSDEVWILADRDEVSVLKGGKHIVGNEAQEILCPNLRFSKARRLVTNRDGTSFLLLLDVTVLQPFAKEPHRGLAIPLKGPAVDLDDQAGEFLARNSSGRFVVDSRGWVWGCRFEGRDPESMSPDGRHIRVFPFNDRFGTVAIESAGPERRIYLRAADKLWRFNPQAVADLDSDRPILPAMRVPIQGCALPDSLGRTWSTWDTPDHPIAVFDGRTWMTLPRPAEQSRESPGYISAFQGVAGAMVFEDSRYRFHLFDAEGRVTANSAEELALKYPDRLRRALPYPPAASANFYHHLVKDATGRIWWARWEKPWGVVDGTTALHGETADFPLGRGHQAVFSVLHPIGDGSRLVAGDERGVAAVVTVRDGRIVAIGPAPVKVGDRPTNWQRNVLRDTAGRTWVMTNQQDEHHLINGVGGLSQAIDSHGNRSVTEEGWLMLEDCKKGLWFRLAGWSPKKAIVRLDPSGLRASLDFPDLLDTSPFAEAPDGTVWTLTASDLVRLTADGQRLTIVARYPVAVTWPASIWCDPQGRVWLDRGNPTTHELICFATPPKSRTH